MKTDENVAGRYWTELSHLFSSARLTSLGDDRLFARSTVASINRAANTSGEHAIHLCRGRRTTCGQPDERVSIYFVRHRILCRSVGRQPRRGPTGGQIEPTDFDPAMYILYIYIYTNRRIHVPLIIIGTDSVQLWGCPLWNRRAPLHV